MADARTSSSSLHVAALGLVLVSGCVQPPCVETYSPLVKLLVGIPLPLYFTMLFAGALMMGINDALRRGNRLPKSALAAVAAACVTLPVFFVLRSPALALLAIVAWPILMGLPAILAFRDQGTDPKAQSWLLCLSGAVEPSADDRFRAGGMAGLLVLVTFIGSCATSCSVSGAGRDCRSPAQRPSPAAPADSESR